MWNIMKSMILHIYKYHKLSPSPAVRSLKGKQRLLRVQTALLESMLKNWTWRP